MTTPSGKPNILIVEDNSADVVLLRYALDRLEQAYELLVLRDGEEALRFVEDHRVGIRRPDPCVIVLDLHLPKHNGLEVLRAIKRTPPLAHIHVVVLTGSAAPSEELEIFGLSGTCLRKPSDLDSYLKLAEDLMAICREGLAAPVERV